MKITVKKQIIGKKMLNNIKNIKTAMSITAILSGCKVIF